MDASEPIPPRAEPARLPVVLLAVSFATFLFLGLLFHYVPDGISEKEESRIFILGWALIPVTVVSAAWALFRAQRAFFPRNGAVFPVFLAAHAAFWLVAMHRLHTAVAPFRPPFAKVLVLFFVFNAGAGILSRWGGPQLARRSGWRWVRSALDVALPFAALAIMLPFCNRPFPQAAWLVVAAAGICSLLHKDIAAFAGGRSARRVFDALVILLLMLLVVDPGIGHWLKHDDNSELHYNFYVGPVAEILAGRTPLVDVNCQYGVGVLYFIAMAFKAHLVAASTGGLGVLVDALVLIQYVVTYFLLRYVLRSSALAALTLFLILFLNYCAVIDSILVYPSAGPLRFLPGYLLLLSVALRGMFPRRRTALSALELVTLGIAAVWSFESFLYALAAYAAVVLSEGLSGGVSRRSLTSLVRRFASAGGAILLAHALVAALTYARAGELPHWSRYLDYIRLYSTQEFGTMLVETWTPWPVVVGVYLASVLAVGCTFAQTGRTEGGGERAVVCGMTAYGIVQFTYFVGRSHPNNLLIVCPPAVFVASYWFAAGLRNRADSSPAFRGATAYVGYAVIGLILLAVAPEVLARYENTALRYLAAGVAPPQYTHSARALAAAQIIERYAAGQKRIGLFVDPNLSIETQLLTQKGDIWPLGYTVQDELLPGNVERAINFKHGLREDDVIFVAVDRGTEPSAGIDSTHRAILQALSRDFVLSPDDCRPGGVCMFRLHKRAS